MQLNATRAASLGSMLVARWRAWVGLAFMIAVIYGSVRNSAGTPPLELVVLLTLAVAVGWLLQETRWPEAGVWVLGLASCGLIFVLPSSGAAVIGIAATLVGAGQRMEVRRGAVAALVLSLAFLLADGLATQWDSLIALAFPALGMAFAYTASASVRRIRLERERAEALLAELQLTRAAEIEHAALAERARIAREIHDVLAHTLSALAVQLEGTRLLLEQRPGDPAAVATVERAHRLASEGLAEARRAIGALRGDSLPGPDGLQRLVDDFTQATGAPARLEISGEPIVLPSEARLALFRTAQEALTNVRKHAQGATSVDVRLCYARDGAELVVEDTAPAPETRDDIEPRAPGGYGLVGMRERAELVGGTLEAGPLPAGFRVRLWLPAT